MFFLSSECERLGNCLAFIFVINSERILILTSFGEGKFYLELL